MILIVEDDKDIADMLLIFFREIAREAAQIAHNVPEALAILDEEKPTAIILDYYLGPGADWTAAPIIVEVRRRWSIWDRPRMLLISAAKLHDAPETHGIPRLLKPFGFQELTAVLDIR